MESRSEMAQDAAQVVELLPGSRFLVLVDATDGDLPDPDELGDLRYHARKQKRAPVLGAGIDEAFLIESVVAAVVSGVISPVVWAPFPAAARWLERAIRKRHTNQAIATAVDPAPGAPSGPDPDFDPIPRATTLVHRVLGSQPGWTEPQLEWVKGDGAMWTVQLSIADRWTATVHMSHDGGLAELAIDSTKR